MNVEVVAIGNEILSGTTVNSNATFISRQLLNAGFDVNRHTALPDDPEQLEKGLIEALKRSQIVITTGGLGPTVDDLTRNVAAKIFDSGFHLDQSIFDDLNKRYHNRLESAEDQATIPDKAQPLYNPIGTAPGLIFKNDQNCFILLPGVPQEMRVMLTDQVIPYLKKTFEVKDRKYRKKIYLFHTREADVDPILRTLQISYPEVEYGIYPNLGLVSVHLITTASDEKTAMAKLEKPYQELLKAFSSRVYESSIGLIEDAVQTLFVARKWTLSTAESCTGGRIASRLVALPGASNYFLGSIIPYSYECKVNLLGVSPKTLSEYGAVSKEVVTEMTLGLLDRTHSDFGIAISGIAGPDGGTADKPVGTVWGSICQKGKEPFVKKLPTFGGSREMIIEASVHAMLGQLLVYTKSI